MEPEKKEPTTKYISLKEFIDDHQKVLAVIGVLVAVSVFFGNNQRLKDISVFISFLCLAATIPLLVQIYNNVDTLKSSWLLIIFINIFTPLMAYIFWYLLLAYRPVWKTQTSNVLLWALIIPLWYVFKHFGIQKKVMVLTQWFLHRWQQRLTERAIIENRKEEEKLLAISNLSDEEKERKRAERETKYQSAKQQILQDNEMKAMRESHIPANVVVALFLFFSCNFLVNRLASPINNQLDKIYESYVVPEASPTPTVSSSPTPMTSPSETPTPVITPSSSR